jgi:hypothetical protein
MLTVSGTTSWLAAAHCENVCWHCMSGSASMLTVSRLSQAAAHREKLKMHADNQQTADTADTHIHPTTATAVHTRSHTHSRIHSLHTSTAAYTRLYTATHTANCTHTAHHTHEYTHCPSHKQTFCSTDTYTPCHRHPHTQSVTHIATHTAQQTHTQT